ncbi:MAG: hypothetical protein EA361_08320 [Bacteroidetes bacterium]|nr:MAG: hypothetical protein EA361_08320 [Bacteroidota bacterium]
MVVFKRPFTFLMFILMMGLLMTSCETSEGEPVYIGYEYFGQTEGKWLVYEVDSTVYDDFLGEVFHYQYQVKEVNAGFLDTLTGNDKMRLERFFRNNDQDPWQIKNVWTSQLTKDKALRTEENITYVKLSFPLWINPEIAGRGNQWDGNVYNVKPSQDYIIKYLHEPMQLGTLVFDSTLRVLQKDFKTLIGEELQYEIYSTHIGMIRKKYIDLSTDIDGTIVRGVDYSYDLIDYGFESY